jgi:hypothetical protein
LNDESCDRLGKFSSSLHYSEAKRDDLRLQQKVDHFRVIHLDEGANNAQRSKSKVLERPPLGNSVQEWIKKKRDVSF